MRLTASQLVADLHEEYTAVLFGNEVFTLFRRLIGIHIFQFLAGNEKYIVGQMFDCIGIFVPHLMLHVLDDLKYLTHSFF